MIDQVFPSHEATIVCSNDLGGWLGTYPPTAVQSVALTQDTPEKEPALGLETIDHVPPSQVSTRVPFWAPVPTATQLVALVQDTPRSELLNGP